MPFIKIYFLKNNDRWKKFNKNGAALNTMKLFKMQSKNSGNFSDLT